MVPVSNKTQLICATKITLEIVKKSYCRQPTILRICGKFNVDMHFPYAFLARTLAQGQFNFIFSLNFILRPFYFILQRLTLIISRDYDIWLTEEMNRRYQEFFDFGHHINSYMVKRELSCLPMLSPTIHCNLRSPTCHDDPGNAKPLVIESSTTNYLHYQKPPLQHVSPELMAIHIRPRTIH